MNDTGCCDTSESEDSRFDLSYANDAGRPVNKDTSTMLYSSLKSMDTGPGCKIWCQMRIQWLYSWYCHTDHGILILGRHRPSFSQLSLRPYLEKKSLSSFHTGSMPGVPDPLFSFRVVSPEPAHRRSISRGNISRREPLAADHIALFQTVQSKSSRNGS